MRRTLIALALCATTGAAQATEYHFTTIGSHVAANGHTVTEYRVTSAGKVWHTCETAEGFEVDCRTGREP